jgi:hypothetical protein
MNVNKACPAHQHNILLRPGVTYIHNIMKLSNCLYNKYVEVASALIGRIKGYISVKVLFFLCPFPSVWKQAIMNLNI